MKIIVPKESLETALSVIAIATASGNDDKELKTHAVFRYRGKVLELLANNGGRLFACAPVAEALTEGMGEGDAFTFPVWRMRQFLSAMDGKEAILEFEGGVLKVAEEGVLGSSGDFGSLSTKDFPFWDETLAASEEVTKVPADKLSDALGYIKNFVSDQETKSPGLVATECRDGFFYATDSAGVTMVMVPGLAKSKMRIHGKDISLVQAFLATAKSTEVSVLEHDRTLFLKRDNGGYLGITRWMSEFPALKLNRSEDPKCSFTFKATELTHCLKVLAAFAATDDQVIHFRVDGDDAVLSVASASGSGNRSERRIKCKSHTKTGQLAEDGYDGFILARRYIESIAALLGDKDMVFGVNWTKKNGYVRFETEKDGIDYLSVVVWARR